jgi:hypothetical protein
VVNTDFGKCNGAENTEYFEECWNYQHAVIDSATQTLYFVARGTDAGTNGIGNYYTYLHAVNIKTGNDKQTALF